MKFTRFLPSITPIDVQDPQFPSAVDANFGALEAIINYIGQDLEGFTDRKMTMTAGTTAAKGQLIILNSSGEMVLADASTADTANRLVGIALEAIASGKEGKVLLSGIYETTGLTAGDILYMDTTAGSWSASKPGASGQIVRVLGYALSTTQFYFEPDRTWSEIA